MKINARMQNDTKKRRQLTEALAEAVKTKRVVKFSYETHDRVAEPYLLGVSETGNVLLRSYQTSGSSKSGELGWKLFDLNKVQALEILDETFDAKRKDFAKNDSAMRRILFSVAHSASDIYLKNKYGSPAKNTARSIHKGF